jgi:hypothetical protein
VRRYSILALSAGLASVSLCSCAVKRPLPLTPAQIRTSGTPLPPDITGYELTEEQKQALADRAVADNAAARRGRSGSRTSQ